MNLIQHVLSIIFVLTVNNETIEGKKNNEVAQESARSESKIVFPFGASMGVAAALAIPVVTDEEIAFVAIIFELTYNLANKKAIPLKFFNERSLDGEIEGETCQEKSSGNETSVSDKAIFSRTSLYRVIEDRLNA
jgi:hypothetical protein